MEFKIKEMSVNLINDYLDFFDNRAFSDGRLLARPCVDC